MRKRGAKGAHARGAHARYDAQPEPQSDAQPVNLGAASAAQQDAQVQSGFRAPSSARTDSQQDASAEPDSQLSEGAKPGERALWGSTLAYKVVRLFLCLTCVIGISIMLYPAAQRLLFAYESVQTSLGYDEALQEMGQESVEQEWRLALEYNRAQAYNLAHDENEIIDPFVDDPRVESLNEEYWSLVNPMGDGMMGYLDIPKINQRLNIYHGTDDDALLKGAGHIQGTSLPVGGESTHCVLSGHRGLAAAKVFTDLDQMRVGDLILVHVLGHDLAYEVDQIQTVKPEEISAVEIVRGEDLMTLVTCTPYAVNTHRLLVRGHRVPYVEPDMPLLDWLACLTPLHIALIAAGLVLLIIVVWRIRRSRSQ